MANYWSPKPIFQVRILVPLLEMTKLKIVTYPSKTLKARSKEVPEITPEIKRLIPQMIEVMYTHEGIGLAAPQIGVSQRIIVVETSDNPRANKGRPALTRRGRPLALLNPVIKKRTGKSIAAEEGCLSLPEIFVPVKRSEFVELICQTPEGKEVKIVAKGLTARIFQHEVDHLNGKLIIDRIPLWKRLSVRRLLKSKERTSSRAS